MYSLPAAVAFVLAGCGRVGFGALPAEDATSDGPADAAPNLGAWGTPVALTALSSASRDESPALSPDGRTLVFESNRPGGAGDFDLYETTRADTSSDFGPPTRLVAVSTTNAEIDPTWGDGGTSIYFTSDESGAPRLFRAVRTGPATYDPPVAVAQLAGLWLKGPAFSRDGNVFVFDEQAPSDLMIASYSTANGFVVQRALSELATGSYQGFATLNIDATAIYFESHSGDASAEDVDIYTATRATPSDPFGASSLLPADVNLPTAVDGDPEISQDERTLIFTSDRAGGLGATDLYMATR